MASKVQKFAVITAVLVFITVALGADSFHIMEAGDTLYSLSLKFDVSVDDLLQTNGINDPSSLSVGMRLRIPGAENPTTNTSAAAVTEYTVRKGDTYYGIARTHGITVDELLSYNSRTENRVLRVGESLIVTTGNIATNTVVSNTSISSGTGTGGVVKSTQPVRVSEVPWWPVAGMKAPMDGKLVGVTIDADPRSYVHAVATGSVVWTGPYRGFGHVVLVDSNGYIYLYGGNEDLFVNVGQNVAAGNRIGRLGTSGPDGGTREMIFSVFREGVPVSPDDAPRG